MAKERLISYTCASLFILFLEVAISSSHVGDTDICNAHEIGNPYKDVILKVDRECGGRKLKSNFKQWTFSVNPGLLQFPIDEDENYFQDRTVKNALFSKAMPTPFKNHSMCKLAAYSKSVTQDILDMSSELVNSNEFLLIASGGGILKGSTPLAHRYGGHQFGVFSEQLGDGRVHILGEYVNDVGERWELQLKGAGRTPYSRHGDGRAVVRSSVREFLCSEAMHHLGVPSTRAVSLVVSEDMIKRDRLYNGTVKEERTAIVLRAAESWFRFGSFEALSSTGEHDLLRQLGDFVIDENFKEIPPTHPDKYVMFFATIVRKTAKLMAQWQSVGFAHGGLNTDNFNILSVSMDYGPFGFLDEYDPEMVPNSSDDEKRYSYEKQPDAAFYNLDKFREALLPLLDEKQHVVVSQVLHGYTDLYKYHFMQIFRSKLGLKELDDNEFDEQLVALLLKIMSDTKADFTMTFRHLGDWNLDIASLEQSTSKLWTLEKIKVHNYFKTWIELYKERISSEGISDEQRRDLMQKVNPRYILRNWIAEDIIQQVHNNNFSLLREMLKILENPFRRQEAAERLKYADPPPDWAADLRVSCSS